MNNFVYGKDQTNNIVCIEPGLKSTAIFTETDGVTERTEVSNQYWVLTSEPSDNSIQLKGNQHFLFGNKFATKSHLSQFTSQCNSSYYKVRNYKQMFMTKTGHTYYNGMKPTDVSVLSFDIETTGLVMDETSNVLLISNTFRSQGRTLKKLFSHDDFESQRDMIKSWTDWVRKMDPSILLGHNIYMFDIPYLLHCAESPLKIGRDGSNLRQDKHTRGKRKDGSQSYDYQNCHIFGRELVDTMFLSIDYNQANGKGYPSFGLKVIIEQEGLIKEGRQFYDAGLIKDNYQSPVEWEKIKKYAVDDADDSLALFDLMIPSFFYYTQSIPMPIQEIINTATGSQVNSFMVRAYLQDGYSIPEGSEAVEYEGGISFGKPGIYKNVYKIDVASLYPSIIRTHKICNREKDPKEYFLKMVDYFTDERLKNKQLAKETKDPHYEALQLSQKIMINSAYGFLGARKLNFNSPDLAAKVTRIGREILTSAINLAEDDGYIVPNADTDSISFTNNKVLTAEVYEEFLEDVNFSDVDGIVWEDDGFFKRFIVVKAKNYIMDDGKKVTIKGSGLKATMKEPALREFNFELIDLLLNARKDRLYDLYHDYVFRICNISDVVEMDQWSSKKTITKAVLRPNRTQEERIKAAISGVKVQEGDKIKVFFRTLEEVCLVQNFDGAYSIDTLLKKLFKTIGVFGTIIDVDVFPNYTLKRNKGRLDDYICNKSDRLKVVS